MEMMLKKLYRKVFPLKSVIREMSEDLRESIENQIATLSSQTERKLDLLRDGIISQIDSLSAKLDGHRESVITSSQLIAADINTGIIAHLTPLRVDIAKQREVMDEIKKSIDILQNEIRASKKDIDYIRSLLEQTQK